MLGELIKEKKKKPKKNDHNSKPTMAENAMVGMLARATVTVTMSPVSVLKTRVEGADLAHTGARGASSAAAAAIKSSSPSSSSSSSSSAVRRVGTAALSVPRALATIARTEGIGALYRGVTPTLMRDCPHAAIHLAAYEALKPLLQALVDAATTGRSASSSSPSSSSSPAPADESIPRPVHAAVLPVAGLCAGVFSSVLTHPPDVLKTHAQLRGTTHTAHGGTLASSASPTAREYWAVARDIWRTRGWRGAYVGLAPRLVRRGLLPAMSWPLYEIAARLRGV
jgi:solute carrier family 25 protein 39/40